MPSSSDDEPSSVGPAPESAVTLREAVADARSAIRTAWRSVQHWVETRGRLTQLVISGGVAMLLEEIVAKRGVVWSVASAYVPVLSDAQLLVVLVGVGLLQTLLQTSKLKSIESIVASMTNPPDATTDGGRDAHRGAEAGFTPTELARLVVLGYAFIGAVIGSSYGVGGAVFGATVGAIFGDELMKSGP